jgi:hypothetical protein
MRASFSIIPVQEAYEDLLRRSLAKISCDLGRLIYLASMRDYNTGSYRHDGLEARFSPAVAREALELAHREIFHQVAALKLHDLVKQMAMYLESCHEEEANVLRAWRRLEPYRILVPLNVNSTMATLFISNIKLALVILPRLREQALPYLSDAWPPRSPAR